MDPVAVGVGRVGGALGGGLVGVVGAGAGGLGVGRRRNTAKCLKLVKTLVAAGSARGAAGKASRVTMRFSAKAKKALIRLRKLTLTLVLSASGDESSGAARKKIKVTLKR